jgi:hypothetical protein
LERGGGGAEKRLTRPAREGAGRCGGSGGMAGSGVAVSGVEEKTTKEITSVDFFFLFLSVAFFGFHPGYWSGVHAVTVQLTFGLKVQELLHCEIKALFPPCCQKKLPFLLKKVNSQIFYHLDHIFSWKFISPKHIIKMQCVNNRIANNSWLCTW